MEVLLNLQNKNVTLNAVHVAPEGTNCCNRLKVHFDVLKDFILIKNRVEFGDSSRPPFKLCVYRITFHSDNAKLREKQRQTKFHPLNFAL